MARAIETFSYDNITDLVTAVNAYLAALVDPTVRGFQFIIQTGRERVGSRFQFTIDTETGGAALATPFVLSIQSADSLSALEALISTFFTAHAAEFVASPRIAVADLDHSAKIGIYGAALLYNATAGATANFALY